MMPWGRSIQPWGASDREPRPWAARVVAVHAAYLSADRRCRPLALVLTKGRAPDHSRFIPVLKKARSGAAGRWAVSCARTRRYAVAAYQPRAFMTRAVRQAAR